MALSALISTLLAAVVWCAAYLAAAISSLRDLALTLALLSWYGRTSNAASCSELPLLHGDISLMVQAFAANGLDVKDLAVLCGAHTLGKAHCPSYAARSSGGNTAAVWLAPAMNDGLEAEIRRPHSHLWRPSPPEPYSQTASPRLPPSPAHARRDLRSRELRQATPPDCLCSGAGITSSAARPCGSLWCGPALRVPPEKPRRRRAPMRLELPTGAAPACS